MSILQLMLMQTKGNKILLFPALAEGLARGFQIARSAEHHD
jgi:hypothetical protein